MFGETQRQTSTVCIILVHLAIDFILNVAALISYRNVASISALPVRWEGGVVALLCLLSCCAGLVVSFKQAKRTATMLLLVSNVVFGSALVVLGCLQSASSPWLLPACNLVTLVALLSHLKCRVFSSVEPRSPFSSPSRLSSRAASRQGRGHLRTVPRISRLSHDTSSRDMDTIVRANNVLRFNLGHMDVVVPVRIARPTSRLPRVAATNPPICEVAYVELVAFEGQGHNDKASGSSTAAAIRTDNEEHPCAICTDPLLIGVTCTLCKHTFFHRPCIEKWARIRRTCPGCRQVFRLPTPALQT